MTVTTDDVRDRWEHIEQSVPADKRADVPDHATVFAAWRSTGDTGETESVSVYRAAGDEWHVTALRGGESDHVGKYNRQGPAMNAAADERRAACTDGREAERGRPSPDDAELLTAIGEVGGRYHVLRALEAVRALNEMDAVAVAEHEVDVETADVEAIAAAFCESWDVWTGDVMGVFETVAWAGRVEERYGGEADRYV